MHCENSNYVIFEEFFVNIVMQNFNWPINHRLSDKVMRFFRSLEQSLELGVNHNWGDWFLYPRYIVIRVYGALVKPHVLPRDVTDIISFLGIIWKLNVSEKFHLRDKKKGSFIPPNLYFSDFEITCNAKKDWTWYISSYFYIRWLLKILEILIQNTLLNTLGLGLNWKSLITNKIITFDWDFYASIKVGLLKLNF